MWKVIVVGAPVLVIALGIAIWPLLSRSYRFSRWEHQRSERRGRPPHRSRVRTDCPICAATFEGATRGEAVTAKHAHVLRAHPRRGTAGTGTAGPPGADTAEATPVTRGA